MNLVVETDVECPWCGEFYPTRVDPSQGSYVTTEDCAVCCRPIAATITCEPGEV
ncbi:MAG: CPXCG motif-containing cysteine-rich protein, partial [Chthoniobacteraceae bacterium]